MRTTQIVFLVFIVAIFAGILFALGFIVGQQEPLPAGHANSPQALVKRGQGEQWAEEWRERAFRAMDAFKGVCDGAELTDSSIEAWQRSFAGSVHAGALSRNWMPWARARMALFARHPEWRTACQTAWDKMGGIRSIDKLGAP